VVSWRLLLTLGRTVPVNNSRFAELAGISW
jgi:hypothetical protein